MKNHFDTPVKLFMQTITQDTDGYPVKTETSSNVWGDVNSVKRTEYYAAETAGHTLSMSVTIPVIDWDSDAVECEVDGKRYRIVRPYQTSLDYIELQLERIRG